MKNDTKHGARLRRKTEAPPPKPPPDSEDTTPDVTKTAAYIEARRRVLEAVARKRHTTYGAIARLISPQAIRFFDDVLRGLSAEGLIKWRHDDPPPRRVERV